MNRFKDLITRMFNTVNGFYSIVFAVYAIT